MVDRRAHYAVADVPAKRLLGFYNTYRSAEAALMDFIGEGAAAELFNLTHHKTPQWVKDLATEASGRTSPEAEIHMFEGIVRISSRYVLSRKASNLMLEEFHWIPDIDDYLEQEQVPGFRGVKMEIGDPDKVEVTVDLDVEKEGTTKDPARRLAYQAVMRLIEDIARFKWHATPEMKDDPFVMPVYTSTKFIIVRNERTGDVDLSWSDDGDVQVVPVEDDGLLKRLGEATGAPAREDELIEAFAANEREHLALTMR
jgi:hypothetical protein